MKKFILSVILTLFTLISTAQGLEYARARTFNVGHRDFSTNEIVWNGTTSECNILIKLTDNKVTIFSKTQQEYYVVGKLAEMDNIVASINNLETKVEKYRPKTAQEKLELRTLDSGPFKQKLSDFFVDKQQEMEKAGKNEYVLTTDDVEDFSPKEIEDSFHTTDDEDDFEY